MPTTTRPSFGIATAPQQVSYDDILRVWREADTIPQIGHAWAFDHLLPIGGDKDGPIFEGWTLLAALAASTSRLRLGLLVTSNRIRPPALLAKIAATVDVVSGGRLDFGIGAGSRTDIPWARREYDAYGLPYAIARDAVGSLAEACTVIKRLWDETQPFDFDGHYVKLTGAFCNPKPVQRPHPPITIGGTGRQRTLRTTARWAQQWNSLGRGGVSEWLELKGVLAAHCADIGRDVSEITCSVNVRYEDDIDEVVADATTWRDAGVDLCIVGLPLHVKPEQLGPLAEALAPLA
jgi:alkanesulfonate monooxygenase SsuD/methylene tetrahydromethanopterin reductase-like flavin-dependent oxidoreductase (luciferase family)